MDQVFRSTKVLKLKHQHYERGKVINRCTYDYLEYFMGHKANISLSQNEKEYAFVYYLEN